MLHPEIRSYAGIDLTQFYSEKLEKSNRSVRSRWERIMMWYLYSSYFVAKDMFIIESVTKYRRLDLDNVSCWKDGTLNLPGMESYNPTLSWVFKVREYGTIVIDMYLYIDDSMLTTDNAWESWKTRRRACYILILLGLQDASRKRTSSIQ